MDVNKKISFSLLKALNVGLEYFGKYLKEELYEDDVNLQFGRAVHCYFLERGKFDDIYAIVDDDERKIGSAQQRAFADYIIANSYSEENLILAYKESYKVKDTESEDSILKKAKELYISLYRLISFEIENSTKIKMSNKDFERIKEFEESINSHKGLRILMTQDKSREEYNELTHEFIYQNEECKAIIDRLVIDHPNKMIYILELKTHSVKSLWSNLKESFKTSIIENGYDKQLAFYYAAVQDFVSNKPGTNEYEIMPFFVVFQKNYFNVVKLYSLSRESIFDALECVQEWIDYFKEMRINKFSCSKEYLNNTFGEEII